MAVMAIVVVLIALLCLVVGAARTHRGPRKTTRARNGDPSDVIAIDPEWLSLRDRLELDEAFTRAQAEMGPALAEALLSRLQPVIRRRAPLRSVRRAPSRGTTRLGFADGTTVLVRSHGGALAQLALIAHRESVILVACEPHDAAARLTFEYAGTRIRALAVAVDQAD